MILQTLNLKIVIKATELIFYLASALNYALKHFITGFVLCQPLKDRKRGVWISLETLQECIPMLYENAK